MKLQIKYSAKRDAYYGQASRESSYWNIEKDFPSVTAFFDEVFGYIRSMVG